jgi:SAM-dependent methyltransferase
MSHKEQRQFCRYVRKKNRSFFCNTNVIDVGSLDINGNNRYLFRRCCYTGIDIVAGKNVDRVGLAKDVLKYMQDYEDYHRHMKMTDVVVSTEMLEHDSTWKESLLAMYEILRPGGLLLITCAGVGRREHGTHKHSPADSPGTNNYYCNVSNEMFANVLPATLFSTYFLNQDKRQCDLQFYGIKKYNGIINNTPSRFSCI